MSTVEPTTLKAKVITQAIAFVVFGLLPILITLMVPFTTLEFRHAAPGVTATVTRYVLIAVPWKILSVENVTKVRADVTPDRTYRGTIDERRRGVKGTSYGTGQLAIVSDGPEVIVQAAPELAKDIAAHFGRFAVAKGHEPLVFEVYASWWLSHVLGGVMTALFALYAIGVVLALITGSLKFVRSQARA